MKIREDTEIRNFPLYCPKCRQEIRCILPCSLLWEKAERVLSSELAGRGFALSPLSCFFRYEPEYGQAAHWNKAGDNAHACYGRVPVIASRPSYGLRFSVWFSVWYWLCSLQLSFPNSQRAMPISGYEPKIRFERMGTIGGGANCCDFHFIHGNLISK